MVLKLVNAHRWLLEHTDGLSGLLGLCDHECKLRLVCELLEHFKYLTSADRIPCFREMAEAIVSGWGLAEAQTQVVAATIESRAACGAQYVLCCLKPRLVEAGWKDPLLVNRIGDAVKPVRDRPRLVLVDDFVGTGGTMLKRIRDNIKNLEEQAAKTGGNPPEIRVCVLAAMQAGKQAIENQGYPVFAANVLERGISDHYEGGELQTARQTMLNMEAELDQEEGREPFHSFGYGQAEALYHCDECNAVNSMFPIFWWPHLKGDKDHRPMFTRLENQPS